jgi:hypothetical protein
MGLEQRQHARRDIVAGDERRRRLDAAFGKPPPLKVHRARIVDLEIGDPLGPLACGACVEARAEDDDLAAAIGELLVEPVIELAGPEPDVHFRRGEAG